MANPPTDYEMLELLRYLAQALGIRGKTDAVTIEALRAYVRGATGVNLKSSRECERGGVSNLTPDG